MFNNNNNNLYYHITLNTNKVNICKTNINGTFGFELFRLLRVPKACISIMVANKVAIHRDLCTFYFIASYLPLEMSLSKHLCMASVNVAHAPLWPDKGEAFTCE